MTTALAERPAQDLSPAAKSKQRLDAFMGAIEKRADQVETLLSDSGIDPKLFIEGCRRALMRDPELVNTSPASFIQSALNCAADGLVPDGRKAAMVRYKGAAQYMPMYQGLLDIAYRSGNFQSIEAHVVYDGDEFDFALGDKPFIHHKPTLETDTSKIRGAYAVARTVNGGVFREVMGKRELDKVRAMSKAGGGPNKDWPGEMARKAPLRRLWKYLPRTPAMDRIADHDDATYDHTALPANDGPKLAPGFAAAAIAPPADEPAPAHDEADFVDEGPDIDTLLEGDHIPDFDGSGGALTGTSEGERAAEEVSPSGQQPSAPTPGEDFPGDRVSTTRAPAGEETQPAGEGGVDPVEWAAEANHLIDNFETVTEIDEFLASPETTREYGRLTAHSPGLARTLDAQVKGKRKALFDREQQRAAASKVGGG